MASVQELVPLIKAAVADVLAENPSDNGDVRLALSQVTALWNNPEHPFQPAEPPPPLPPAVTLSGIEPASGVVNTDLTVTVTGTGFSDGMEIAFDGDPVPTTFVSETELTGNILAANNDVVDTFEVTVDGTGPLSFEVTEAPITRRSREPEYGREDEPNRRRRS